MNNKDPESGTAKHLSYMDECDIHDFNSHHLGLSTLHPGGLGASGALAALCGMQPGLSVLDIACGKGTSSRFFTDKFGCKVTGIDIDEDYVQCARMLSKKKSALGSRLQFINANAENLPFADNAFDIAIFQSVLVLMDHADKAMKEAARVIKPGGRLGILEFTWLEQPSQEILEEALDICGHCYYFTRANPGDWQALIRDSGLELKEAKMYKLETPKIGDEGISTVLKVLWKITTNSALRNRFSKNNAFFLRNLDRIGYGLYVGENKS